MLCLAAPVLGLAAPVLAQTPAPVASASTTSSSVPPRDTDPLVLARWTDRVGDGVVLTWLSPEQAARDRELAVRATPFLREPELALSALVGIMADPDPDLAPAAAAALARIVEDLSPALVMAREADLPPLRAVVRELSTLAENPRVRPDVSARAAAASVTLADRLPPDPPGVDPAPAPPEESPAADEDPSLGDPNGPS